MARMRFPGRPRPRTIYASIAPDERQPEHLGDLPPAPPEPPTVRWSLTTYPYADPARDEEDPADG